MAPIPRQFAAGLSPSTIRLSAPVDSHMNSHRVRLSSGDCIDCRAIVLAVEGPEASGLTDGMIRPPGARSTTGFYYAAPQPPFHERLLVLNGDNHSPNNDLCVVSNVENGYAPAGQSLINVSVIGEPESASDDVEYSVCSQLREWYGVSVDSWSLLKRYHIPYALPSQPARIQDGVLLPTRLCDDVYHCGDYTETASRSGCYD
jgi:Flavin containing amine oxidoreductase